MSKQVDVSSDRMKILAVSSFFPLSTKDKIPQFLLEQIGALASHYPHSEIVVLAASRHGGIDEKIAANVTVKRFAYFWPTHKQNLTSMGILPSIKKNKWNLFQLPLLFLFEYFAIVKEIKRFKPDYIYSHWFLPQGLLCYWLAKRFQIPHVFTSHSYDVEICKHVPIIGPKIVRSAISSMKAVTVVSQRTLNGISQFFEKDHWEKISSKFKVIPMGVNLPVNTNADSVEEIRAQYGFSDKKIIFFMGRFVAKKGIDVLLQALVELLKYDSSVILVLAGDGILKKEIESLIRTLDLSEHVLLPGFITSQDKDAFLRIADIYVLPSIESADGDREGLPVSLLESLSYGKVCIATNESGAEEVLTSGENGFICAAGNSDLLLKEMKMVMSLNKQERQRVEVNAQETAKRYSWPHIISKQSEHFFN